MLADDDYSSEEPDESSDGALAEAAFEKRTERVVEAVRGKVGHDFRTTPVRLAVFRKVDKANRKVVYVGEVPVGNFYDAATRWARGVSNLPGWLQLPVLKGGRTAASALVASVHRTAGPDRVQPDPVRPRWLRAAGGRRPPRVGGHGILSGRRPSADPADPQADPLATGDARLGAPRTACAAGPSRNPPKSSMAARYYGRPRSWGCSWIGWAVGPVTIRRTT